MKKYRICGKCLIQHYENCETCFGFGVYDIGFGKTSPVHGGDAALKIFPGTPLPCPECGSTKKGIPTKTKLPIGEFTGELTKMDNKTLEVTITIKKQGGTEIHNFISSGNAELSVDFIPTFISVPFSDLSAIEQEQVILTIKYNTPVIP